MSLQNLGNVDFYVTTLVWHVWHEEFCTLVIPVICLCPQPTLAVTGDVEKCLVPLQAFLTDFRRVIGDELRLQKCGRDRWKSTCRYTKRIIYDRWLLIFKHRFGRHVETYKIYPPSCCSCLASPCFSAGNAHPIGSNDVSPPEDSSHDMAILHSGTFRNYPQKSTSFYNSLSKITWPAVHRTWGLWHRRSLSQRWSQYLRIFSPNPPKSTCHALLWKEYIDF